MDGSVSHTLTDRTLATRHRTCADVLGRESTAILSTWQLVGCLAEDRGLSKHAMRPFHQTYLNALEPPCSLD